MGAPWTLDTEIEELKRFQIGLAPLPEDRWTRGKCGLRLLQYMAASVPAVASPVGTQEEVTAAGAAIPASSDADWVPCGARHTVRWEFGRRPGRKGPRTGPPALRRSNPLDGTASRVVRQRLASCLEPRRFGEANEVRLNLDPHQQQRQNLEIVPQDGLAQESGHDVGGRETGQQKR